MAVVEERMEIDLTGLAFTDELQSSVGASAFTIDHDWFWGGADLEIWTGVGQTGTKLTEGAGDDYVLSAEDTYLTAQSGKTVYGQIQVVNAAYQAVALYFNGEYIADSVKAAHINSLQDQIDALGGAADHLTLGSQTIDAGAAIGDPIFSNVTKETVDLCDVADWTDDAEMTSSVNTSEKILGNALNLTKDTGANTVASLAKTVLVQVDFTSKELNLHLYIDDAGTLADLTTLACLVIRYGSTSGDYYEWQLDKSELAVGWNTITGLTSALADSTTGTPGLTVMDYAYLALNTNNAGDTWASGKVIMDYWFVRSDEEWQLAAEGTPTPTGIKHASTVVALAGHCDIFSNLIPGQWYWMKSDGSATTIPGEAYNATRLYYAITETVAIVAIAVEANNQTATVGTGMGGTIKGFSMGGDDAAKKADIEDLTFSGETSLLIAATLDTAKTGGAGASGPTNGYMFGGHTGGVGTDVDVIEDMVFAGETSDAIVAVLATARTNTVAVYSALNAYIMGGDTNSDGTTVTAVIDRFVFAAETCGNLAGVTLDTAICNQGAVTSGSKGYVAGGRDGAVYSVVIEDMIFASETSQAIGGVLTDSRFSITGVFSATKGYFMGGQDAGLKAVIDAITFAGEAVAALIAVIPTASGGGDDGIVSGSKGYRMGGADAGYIAAIAALTFSDDTCADIVATLDDTKYRMAGVQY